MASSLATIHQQILALDSHLSTKELTQLSLKDAQKLLDKIEAFHQAVLNHGHQNDRLIAAGCRLCSDLAERVLNHLVDILQNGEADIDQMAAMLRYKMQERYQAGVMLKQLQGLRRRTNTLGKIQGLGVVL